MSFFGGILTVPKLTDQEKNQVEQLRQLQSHERTVKKKVARTVEETEKLRSEQEG